MRSRKGPSPSQQEVCKQTLMMSTVVHAVPSSCWLHLLIHCGVRRMEGAGSEEGLFEAWGKCNTSCLTSHTL